jgi:hypothetical protein
MNVRYTTRSYGNFLLHKETARFFQNLWSCQWFAPKERANRIFKEYSSFKNRDPICLIRRYHWQSLLEDSHLKFTRSHAKILSQNQIQKGQFAWSLLYTNLYVQQRERMFLFSNHSFKTCIDHQRLHARNLNFASWLAGFTDADGCFSIIKSNEKYNLNFSIAQAVYNIRVLAFIKKHIGVGSISISKKMAVYRVRNAIYLDKVIFSLFEKAPLQTFKHFHAKKLKLATMVMLDQRLSTAEKRDCLSFLRTLQAPDDVNWQFKHTPRITEDWIIGFMEAEASFFITKKDKNRFVCSFGITQKRDRLVLEAIRRRFSIPAKVRWNVAANAYMLETTNQKALSRIADFAYKKFQGMKSLELKLWCRALYYQQLYARDRLHATEHLSGPPTALKAKVFRKMEEIQNILRRLKNRQLVSERRGRAGQGISLSTQMVNRKPRDK